MPDHPTSPRRPTDHRLDPAPGTTAHSFSPGHQPVLTVDPGDTLVVRSLDANGSLQAQTYPGETVPRLDGQAPGHCLTGPIAVRGTAPGDLLEVRLESLVPDPWGWTVAGTRDDALTHRLALPPGQPAWLLWELDATSGTARESRGFRRPLAPFLGVIGLAPAEPGEHSTIPPRAGTGGNIDCRELVAGSTLYLPVAVPGALLYLGDGHGAQGDGEVGGTAIECGMSTTLTLRRAAGRPLDTLHAQTPAGRVTFGFDADLNRAAADALADMVTWLQASHDLDRTTALALASTCVDLRVTQVANQTWGVHALLPAGLLAR